MHPSVNPRKHCHGFTLIELMIVVAIIGILAAVAYPSYVEHVRRGKRAEVQTALLETAQFMQRYYAANNRYDENLSGTKLTKNDLPPASIPNLAYTIDFAQNSLTATGFTLLASPTGSMAQDRCGSFSLDQLGHRTVINQTGATAKDCWK